MSLNADLIRTRCEEIEQSVRRLERFQSVSEEEFLADQDGLDVACYRLLLAIEAALALCYHVTARKLARVPEEYAHCFGLLSEAGILPVDLAENLKRMARFRNLLVHMYWKVDYRRVHQIIGTDLADLRAFAQAITGLI